MRSKVFSTVLLAAAIVPAVARADAAQEVADGVEYVATWMPSLRESPASRLYGSHDPADGCRKAVAKGKKAGLGDDAKIFSRSFVGWDETHYDGEHNAYLELGELGAICDEYAELLLMIPAAGAQEDTAKSLKIYSTVAPGDLGADMGEQMVKAGKDCMAATDKAIKAGAPADRKTLINDESLSLSEGREQICQAMIDFGGRLSGDIKDAHAKAYEEIAAKYKKVGVKGEKLDLFVEYDNTYWLGKGCEKVMDVKKQAKAKKLHQWWDNPDGTVTIRTYTFKGNKIKSVKNKVFTLAENAYKACK